VERPAFPRKGKDYASDCWITADARRVARRLPRILRGLSGGGERRHDLEVSVA
jgi:hypothetical protein